MKVAIVKYNAGNICSVDYALRRLGVEAIVTSDKEELLTADKVIFREWVRQKQRWIFASQWNGCLD